MRKGKCGCDKRLGEVEEELVSFEKWDGVGWGGSGSGAEACRERERQRQRQRQVRGEVLCGEWKGGGVGDALEGVF